jgi:hypothetical protein
MTHTRIRWDGVWATDFDEGPHMDGYRDGRYVARVVKCRKLAGLDVLPYPSGRRRRLYLALADVGGTWGLVGVFKSLRTAKQECERVLPAKTATEGQREQSR